MPTVQQLPQAVSVNPTDELMIDQDGVSVAATVQQLVAAGAPSVTLIGDVTGSGTGTIITTLAPVITPGTFNKVAVNAKGQVIAGGPLAAADIDTALGFIPYSAANPAGFITSGGLAPVATSGRYADLSGRPALGSLSAQDAGAVAITGGTLAGVDLSGTGVVATGGSTSRSLATRAADVINVLDYGADASGVADSTAAFAAAMNAAASGTWGKVWVPKGTYRVDGFLNQPHGRSIAIVFDEGAVTTGTGGFGVDRIESLQGPFSLWQAGGGYFGFTPSVGAPQNYAFHTQIVNNNPSNSAAVRVGWSRNYTNYNYYGKYNAGIDIAEQNIYSWPHCYDNTSGWGHWEIISGLTYDEDSAARAHVSGSAEHSEFDIVNNGPEAGWTWKSGQGVGVQGMSMDPWGQNGLYGGHILFSYSAVGSYDGQNGGVNQRWASYPAVFSQGNAPPMPQNSTIVVSFDVGAHGTASLTGGGGVAGVSISNGGGAYTSTPTVVFTGTGVGATGTPVMLGGAVVGVTMTAAGSGYTSPPVVSFTGGGVAGPAAVTVPLNGDGAHGDLVSTANAINAAGIQYVRASVTTWGGVVSRLVVFGTAPYDLGALTLGGSALGVLGMNAGTTATQRDTMVVVLGGTSGVAPGDQLTLNGRVVTVGGSGTIGDVVAAINTANIIGIQADTTATGQLVLTCWVPQNPGGLLLTQPTGFTTLQKLRLSAGTFWPPTPPKGFATAYGELTSPICRTTDQFSIAATDLSGTTYGPVTVTCNGGAGSGWPLDVAQSVKTALLGAGFYSGTYSAFSAAPAIVATATHGGGGNQGLLIRNTAGGTLTLANVTGTPLTTLGIQPGTYQPGGYSAGSQNVFMAAEDAIAPQGRGIFLGGASNATDRTTWPHAPLEARGNFLHGLRTDKANFGDNAAVLLGASQSIAFGSGSGSLTLSNNNGILQVNGTTVAVPTAVSQLTNDASFIASSAIPPASGMLLGGSGAAGAAAGITVGANLTLAGGTLSASGSVSAGVASFNARSGAITLSGADIGTALGYTAVNKAGDTMAALAVTGTHTAPTPAPGDNSGNVATTAFVTAALAALFSFSGASGPAPLQIFQRTSQTGTPATSGTLAGLGRGAAPVGFSVTSTGLPGTVQYRLYDANSNGATTAAGTGTPLSGWITTTVGFAAGTSAVTLSVPASAYDYYIDLAPNLSTGAPVRVGSRFAVGERVAAYGQSLAVDWWFGLNNAASSNPMAGLTPALALANHAGRAYASAASGTPAAAWAEPADGGTYASAGVTEFTNRLAGLAGVRVACVGYAHTSESIAQLAGSPDWIAFLANISASGGAFGSFVWIQGHTDATLGTTTGAYQNALGSLVATLQAAYPAVGFKTVIVGIGALSVASGYTIASVNAVRQAQLAYVAANPGTAAYVAMLDTPLFDGVHPTQAGQRVLARHIYRAVAKLLGLLAQGDAGPQVTAATRASASPWIYLSTVQAGGSAWVGVGGAASQAAQFQVFNAGATTAPYAFDATTPIDLSSPARIGLKLATTPANTQALDVWYRPYGDTATLIGAGIYDTVTDVADSDLGGRQLGLFAGAITAAAPGSGGGGGGLPTLTTTGGGGGGGAMAVFLQLDAAAGLFSDAPGGTAQASNGGIVKAWADQSGSGNHLVLPASLATLGGALGNANAPTLATGSQNGLPGLAFNGSQALTSQASVTWPALLSGTHAFTALTVARVTGQGGGGGAVLWNPQVAASGSQSQGGFMMRTGSGQILFNLANIDSVQDPAVVGFGTLMKVVLRYDGAGTLKLLVNGGSPAATTGASLTAQSWTQFVLGTYGTASGFSMTGTVHELDFWSGMADDASAATLAAYATTKWGS